MMNRLGFLLIAVLALLASACYQFPPPTVVKQTNPSPLVGAKDFIVAPVTFNGFTFEGAAESEWLKTRSAKQNASWANDKATMGAKMMKMFGREKLDEQTFALGAAAGAGQFAVAINFDRYDGQMRWTAEIRDATGAVVDVVRDPLAVTMGFNTALALESGAQLCAMMISKYLHSRAFPEPEK